MNLVWSFHLVLMGLQFLSPSTDYLELGTVEGHDSTIHFVTDVGPTPRARSISLRHLPLRDVGQLSPTSCYIHGNCE